LPGASAGHGHGWSPECGVGLHGIATGVKQWHEGFVQLPAGQLHSEQRMRHRVPVTQQNHSPEVIQPSGQPPPTSQLLQLNPPARLLQRVTGEKQGLHGPPGHPTHPDTEPSATSVPVSQRPAPSEPALRNLKNWRREERRASARLAAPARASPLKS
jgi:hypothetical protein